MKVVADLHVHSKYARGCSPQMGMERMAEVARIKGIDLVGTGDFTHPKYFEEIKQAAASGKGEGLDDSGFFEYNGMHFVPTVEINNTFESSDGKKRRVHSLIVMPGLEAAEQFAQAIGPKSKLGVDGRPWVRMGLAETVEIARSIHPQALVIPAHIWTPWFGVFGAKGGFDSLKEALDGDASHVHAIETGLSSDPAMNWRCSWLDGVQLVSFSDAHSPDKLGREATVFELKEKNFASLFDALAHKDKGRLSLTYEFFPQEGKYHADGHRDCGISLMPEETEKLKGICPKCGKKLTVGVLHRIAMLGDRPAGEKPANAAPYESIVPLREVIAMALDCGQMTQKAVKAYDELVRAYGSEFNVLHAKKEEIAKLKMLPDAQLNAISVALEKMQTGHLYIAPGYDGQYGVVSLEKPDKKES